MIQTTQPIMGNAADMGGWTSILQQHGLSTMIAVALLWVFVTFARKMYARTEQLEDRQFKLAGEVIAKNTEAIAHNAAALDRFSDVLERLDARK